MDEQAYSLAADVEAQHWWFRGRRAVLQSVLKHSCPASHAPKKILEVGCGNGGNLPLLASYGDLFAVEGNDAARTRAIARGIGHVEKGWLPHDFPFATERFDLIAALDVVEHIDDDLRSLELLHDRLTQDGLLLMTVPAYRWLWSSHDVFSHHKRRYSRTGFVALVEQAGLDVVYSTYFNSLLFPCAVVHLKLGGKAGLQLPPRSINRVLEMVFSMEKAVIPRWSLPFGLSILVCARRRTPAAS